LGTIVHVDNGGGFANRKKDVQEGVLGTVSASDGPVSQRWTSLALWSFEQME